MRKNERQIRASLTEKAAKFMAALNQLEKNI